MTCSGRFQPSQPTFFFTVTACPVNLQIANSNLDLSGDNI